MSKSRKVLHVPAVQVTVKSQCHAYIVGTYTKIPTNLGSNARSASSGRMWAVQELIRRPAVLHVNFAISLRLFNIS